MRFANQALAAAAVVGVAAASSSAFTAGNTGTPDVAVGQAQTITSGYGISFLDYTITYGASADITTVVFRLTPTDTGATAPTEARVRLVAAASGGTYFPCTVQSTATLNGGLALANNGKDVTCAVTGVTAATAGVLDIVASSV